MTLHAGYAQAVITPSLERTVYLAGFGRNRMAQAVHDDLFARALALRSGAQRAVYVAVDLLGLGRRHCREIEATVRAQAGAVDLFIAATHTHHGPDTMGLWGPDEARRGVDPAYLAWLKERIAATALAALERPAPVLLCAASTQVAGVAKNGRDPEVVDHELTCLQFRPPGGDAESAEVLATWLIFPCHPEVLWDDNTHITSDYCAALRTTVEAATGAPALVMVGALGGMMTPDMGEHTFAAADRMGRRLGRAAVDALAGAPVQPQPGLQVARRTVALPLQNPLFQLAQDAGVLDGITEPDGTMVTEASLLWLGDVALLGVPGELLPRLGLAYKAQLRAAGARTAGVMGLVNDEIGYILHADDFTPPEEYTDPGESYEESMSVGPETGPLLSRAVDDLVGFVMGRS